MHIVIIGSGIAGDSAATTVRQLSSESRITIVSEDDEPLYSPCALPYYLAGHIGREKLYLKSLKDYSADGIDVLFGTRVTALDTQDKVVSLDSGTLTYDKLVIATGSKPLLLPIEGIDQEGVFVLKSVKDTDLILSHGGKAAAVIGAGPIGIETSIALRRIGYRVFLIELCDWILPRLFDQQPAQLLARYLIEHDIEVLTSEALVKIHGDGRVSGVSTNKRDLECDLVVLSLGMVPDTQLAEDTGLVLGPLCGVDVDREMATSEPDVYACGDCIETEDIVSGRRVLSLLWPSARQQGEIAGYNCLGYGRRYPGSISMLGLNFYDVHAVSFGLNAAGVASEHQVEVVEESLGSGYYRLVAADGLLVGMQAVGMTRGVGQLLAAMKQRVRMEEMMRSLRSPLPAGQPLWRYILSPESATVCAP